MHACMHAGGARGAMARAPGRTWSNGTLLNALQSGGAAAGRGHGSGWSSRRDARPRPGALPHTTAPRAPGRVQANEPKCIAQQAILQ